MRFPPACQYLARCGGEKVLEKSIGLSDGAKKGLRKGNRADFGNVRRALKIGGNTGIMQAVTVALVTDRCSLMTDHCLLGV